MIPNTRLALNQKTRLIDSLSARYWDEGFERCLNDLATVGKYPSRDRDNWSREYPGRYLVELEDSLLCELAAGLDIPIPAPRVATASADPLPDGFRLSCFISHRHTDKLVAKGISASLERYGIDGFVAHEDIEPNHEWLGRLKQELQSCHLVLALLSKEFRESDYTNQECGWALGRGVPVVCLNLGAAPSGFLNERQAVPPKHGREASQLCQAVVESLLSFPDDPLKSQARTAVVEALVRAPHYSSAIACIEVLEPVRHDLSTDQRQKINAATTTNSQLSGLFPSYQKRLSRLCD